ncbi:uncharacterized protein RG961_002619 [Leptosomus discolor]
MLWGYGSSALHPPAGKYAETGMSCEGAVSARTQLTRAECQLAPFHHGHPFFCPGGTRRVERIPSGLQGQEATLRAQVSLPPLGMLLSASALVLPGLSLPGLALVMAWGQKGTGGALAGCGQWTGAAAAEAGEARERWRTTM